MFNTWAAFPTSYKLFQPFLPLRGISTAIIWKGSDLFDPICKPACQPFAFTLLLQLEMLFFCSLAEEAGAATPYSLLSGPSRL